MRGIEIIDLRSFYEEMTGKLLLNHMDLKYLICSAGFPHNKFLFTAKRAVDVLSAVVGLIVSSPIWPLLAILVKIDSPGPVLYRQVRVGFLENPFVLYKFRTMKHDAESETGAIWAQENDSRLRPIGKFLRKTRLDELPQLFNVLKGEMSFVGPRPERPEFVEQLNELLPFYAKRNFIKPGITGWAQINYPYGSSVEDAYEKLCYDLYYFKNMTLLTDVLIVLQTFKVILWTRGAR
jgi:exopolysaccharide biosynthesis polyprenyl glycosylphosphotransferase